MTTGEAAQLAEDLKSIEPDRTARPASLAVDTFHHAYLEFDDQFILPSVNLYGIELDQARQLLAPLIERVPQFVRNCYVLPQPRPSKENNYLHLA